MKERSQMMKEGIWDHRVAEYYFSGMHLWTRWHGSHSGAWNLHGYCGFTLNVNWRHFSCLFFIEVTWLKAFSFCNGKGIFWTIIKHLNVAIVERFIMLFSSQTERKIDTKTHTLTHSARARTQERERQRDRERETYRQIKAQFSWRAVLNTYSFKYSPRVQRQNTED